MIVTLTGPQWNAIQARIPDDWRTTMQENRRHTYGRTHAYDLPAVCWRGVLNHLIPQATGPNGGFTKGPDALYSAISKMMRRVLEIEQHPALTVGLAVTGTYRDVIPAWQTVCPTVRSPYPQPPEAGWQFVLLRPRHFTERGWGLTTWHPDYHALETESLTYHEDVQLVLGRQFGVVVGELGGIPDR